MRTGDIVAGKFRIERVLGQGGMGVVVAARHLQLDETVALKFLRPHAVADRDALARFTREARAAAKLKSEHVARVLDAGVGEDGTPYIAMEYLDGRTLGQVLEDEGRLEVATAADYAIQTCEALADAHARGIVHRDIKPENLFLVERAQGWRLVKVLDFGISKLAMSLPAETGNVATQSMMGSPCYMSPEQLRSTASVDHRTDLWSLGVTLFELLAGGTAYSAGQTLPQLIAAILERPAPRLTEIWPDVPPELSDVVARCMAKEREARFESAAELALALLPFAPKRCRTNVERALAMSQPSEKISSRVSVTTEPPPPPATSRTPFAPANTLKSATSSKVTPEPGTLDTLAAPTVAPAELPRRGLPRGVVGGLAIALIGVGLAWFAGRPTSAPPPAPSAASTAAIEATPKNSVEPDAPAFPPPPATTAEPAEAGPPSPAASAPAAKPPHHAPVAAPARPAASGPAQGLDIRMER